MSLNPTAQQLAFFNDVANGSGHLLLRARAGCGKTTTAEAALRFVPKGLSVVFVAFAKTTATELERRLKDFPNVEGRTTHSFGLKVLRDNLGDVEIVKDRVVRLAAGYARSRTEQYALAKAVSFAKMALADNADEIEALCCKYGVEMGEWPRRFTDRVQELLRRCMELDSGVDYDDMIWLPIVRSDVIEMPRYDVVMVDEYQDLCKAQEELVVRACGTGGRIFAVGDDRQSVYGFRGADSDAIPNFIKRLQPTILPLSQTFRCAKAIVKEAQKIVPDITARDEAPEGIVRSVSYAEMLNGVEYNDFVLSRTNAPLVRVAMSLLVTDCRVTILGRDIGQGLVSLIWKLRGYNAQDLIAKAAAWAAHEAGKMMNHDPPQEDAASLALDKAECIATLTKDLRTTDQVVERVRRLFGESASNDSVVLSTTHKAKGLERDRVWVLRDTYCRPRRAEVVSEEEKNLLYCAVTRAKNELYLVKELP